MKKLLALAIMLAMMATFSGCWAAEKAYEKTIESAIESESGGDVDIDFGEGYTFTDEEGNEMTFAMDTEAPDDWPSEVPLNKDWNITSSSSYSFEGATDMSVTMMCGDCTGDEVVEFYRDGLAGWEETGHYESSSAQWGDSATLSFSDEDGMKNVNVYYSKYGEEASVTVGYTEYSD